MHTAKYASVEASDLAMAVTDGNLRLMDYGLWFPRSGPVFKPPSFFLSPKPELLHFELFGLFGPFGAYD